MTDDDDSGNELIKEIINEGDLFGDISLDTGHSPVIGRSGSQLGDVVGNCVNSHRQLLNCLE